MIEICESWVFDDAIEMKLIEISDFTVYKWGKSMVVSCGRNGERPDLKLLNTA